MFARLALLAAALFATAEATPPPALLSPYIKADRFEAGDYRSMRGRFDDASAADKANWRAVQAWLTTCASAGRARVEADLRAIGIAQPRLANTPLSAPLCTEIAFATPGGISTARFADFEADLRAAKPIADTFLYAVRGASEAAEPGSNLS